MNREDARYMACSIAMRCWGTPYVWGGDDVIGGFDCSGFVQELLYSVGALDPREDRTAQGLYEFYKEETRRQAARGYLVFWWNSTRDKIRHVEFCLNDSLSIGASGGGSATLTLEDARARNAFVKIRPVEGRGIIAGYVDPFSKSAQWHINENG